MRVLFWVLVAVGLGAFFFGAAHQRNMTPEESRLFWGSVVTLIGVSVAFLCGYYLIFSLKKRVIVGPGRFRGRVVERDLEPIRYWCTFTFYMVIFFLYAGLAFKTCRGLFAGSP